MLPKGFPRWRAVYWWFRRFMRRFLFETIHDVELMIDRERAGREASPTAGVIDSQSVKPPAAKARWRRLVRDHEQRIAVSKAMIQVALGSLLLRRITH
jgi:transposase